MKVRDVMILANLTLTDTTVLYCNWKGSGTSLHPRYRSEGSSAASSANNASPTARLTSLESQTNKPRRVKKFTCGVDAAPGQRLGPECP